MKLALAVAAATALSTTSLGQKMPEELWPAFTGLVIVHERTWDGIHGGFTQPGNPQVITLGTAINSAYSTQQSSISAGIVSVLASKGVYGINLQLAPTIDSTTVAPMANGVRFAFFLRQNKLHCTAATNSIFGSWADPTFDITCDLMIILTLQVGPSTSPMTVTAPGKGTVTLQPISITSVTASPIHIVATTANVAVGLALGLGFVDISKEIPTSLSAPSGPFATALASALPFVGQAAQQGYTAMESDLENPTAQATNVDVFLTKSNVPTTGNGVITGKIVWPASQGNPNYPNAASAGLPLNPGFLANFPLIQVEMPYTTYDPKAGPIKSYVNVGYATTHVNEATPTGTIEVDYSVSGLPYNAPLYVTVADSYNYPDWVEANLGQTYVPTFHPKVFTAAGWQGWITIFDPASRRLVQQRVAVAPPGPVRPGSPPARILAPAVLTNPNGYSEVDNINWTWHFANLLPPGLTPIRLVGPGEAVERFGAAPGNTTKAGG